MDIVRFLTRAAALLAQLAGGLVSGDHIESYFKQSVHELEIQNDFSELSSLEVLNKKHEVAK